VPKLARPEDAHAFASVSHAAKLSYREWARPGWKAPSQAAEMTRWKQRLADDAGWGLLARDLVRAIGTIHFTDARTDGGAGEAIPGRAHLSGLFVLPARWGEGIGSALLARAVEEMRSRSYRSAQLFTAVDNRRSRRFYEGRGWHLSATDTHEHDGLWVAAYELNLIR
jgi:GNAT superfamily N-acetyltransferase